MPIYSPDICSCIIDITEDSLLNSMLSSCATHSAASAPSTRFSAIMDEVKTKNWAEQTSLDNGPNTLYDMNPSGGRQRKPTIGYTTTWAGVAPARTVTIRFTGITLTNAQRTTIQTALNTRFGAGKVTIA